jgi:hypothetical protein
MSIHFRDQSRGFILCGPLLSDLHRLMFLTFSSRFIPLYTPNKLFRHIHVHTMHNTRVPRDYFSYDKTLLLESNDDSPKVTRPTIKTTVDKKDHSSGSKRWRCWSPTQAWTTLSRCTGPATDPHFLHWGCNEWLYIGRSVSQH